MRFLVAEDDGVSRLLLRQILLKGFGCEVVEATDGMEAWRKLSDGCAPDLLFLDIMMPRKSGVDLLRDMRADKRFERVKVIMCTALNDRQTVTQVAMLNVSGYILKPYVAQKILQQVQAVLGQRPADCKLEDPASVQARLGIDAETYFSLLDMMVQDVAQGTAAVRTALANEDRRGAAMRLNAISGAARNLGATGLVDATSRIEALVGSAPSARLVAELQQLDEEYERLAAAAATLHESANAAAACAAPRASEPATPADSAPVAPASAVAA
jgi:two-component system chemotaxis response regulator CheY